MIRTGRPRSDRRTESRDIVIMMKEMGMPLRVIAKSLNLTLCMVQGILKEVPEIKK